MEKDGMERDITNKVLLNQNLKKEMEEAKNIIVMGK